LYRWKVINHPIQTSVCWPPFLAREPITNRPNLKWWCQLLNHSHKWLTSHQMSTSCIISSRINLLPNSRVSLMNSISSNRSKISKKSSCKHSKVSHQPKSKKCNQIQRLTIPPCSRAWWTILTSFQPPAKINTLKCFSLLRYPKCSSEMKAIRLNTIK